MKNTVKIIKYQLQDVLRVKWIVVYALFYLAITDILLRFGGDTSRVLVSLMNIVLIMIPLVNIVFGCLYFYNAREFMVLILSQPVKRKSLYLGMYIGFALPLALSFLAGTSIPFLYFGLYSLNDLQQLGFILFTGLLLTLIFLAISFSVSTLVEDKVKGFGFAILLWFFFTVIFDALILFFIYVFGDYPLEKAVLFISVINPVDLARILILMKFNISVLMGYTGAVFHNYFGTDTGMSVSVLSLMIWLFLPLYYGIKRFQKKDF
jgi:Cu-processing system permease protein